MSSISLFFPTFTSLALTPSISFYYLLVNIHFFSFISTPFISSLSPLFYSCRSLLLHIYYFFISLICLFCLFWGTKQTLAVGKGRLKRETAQIEQLLSADRTNLVGCYCKLGAVCPFFLPLRPHFHLKRGGRKERKSALYYFPWEERGEDVASRKRKMRL